LQTTAIGFFEAAANSVVAAKLGALTAAAIAMMFAHVGCPYWLLRMAGADGCFVSGIDSPAIPLVVV